MNIVSTVRTVVVALATVLAASSAALAQNLFVSGQYGNTISEITPNGTVTQFAVTGLSNPRGLAFDAAGNFYVANAGSSTIEKFTPDGTASVFATSGVVGPIGLVVDPQGRVIIANDGDNSVVRFDSAGNPTVLLSGAPLNTVTGLAVDRVGNLYIGNQGDQTIIRRTPDGALATFSTGIYNPQGMAFDSAGNLYVMNTSTRAVIRIPPGGGTGTTFATAPTGSTPFGLAIDREDNVYVSDYSFSRIYSYAQSGISSNFATLPSQSGPSYMAFRPVPTFFTGQFALANGVYFLSFDNGNYFGYYSYLSDPHYIYHFDLGYEYAFDANDGKSGVYLYDFKSGGFFYTSPTFPFPYLYDFTLNTVLYYYPDPDDVGHYNTDGVRYFYDFASGSIISK